MNDDQPTPKPPAVPAAPAPSDPDTNRLARIETRLVRLMIHAGLNPDGTPITPPKQESTNE